MRRMRKKRRILLWLLLLHLHEIVEGYIDEEEKDSDDVDDNVDDAKNDAVDTTFIYVYTNQSKIFISFNQR